MVYVFYHKKVNNATRRRALILSERDEDLVKYYLPKKEVTADLADFFSVFSDATRVRILSSLCITEMCVTDLCRMLSERQSTVSHQLAFLRSLHLVKTRRAGKIVRYSLANPYIVKVLDLGTEFLGY